MEAESKKEWEEKWNEEIRDKIIQMKSIETFFKTRRSDTRSLPNRKKLNSGQDLSSYSSSSSQKLTQKENQQQCLQWGPGQKRRISLIFNQSQYINFN